MPCKIPSLAEERGSDYALPQQYTGQLARPCSLLLERAYGRCRQILQHGFWPGTSLPHSPDNGRGAPFGNQFGLWSGTNHHATGFFRKTPQGPSLCAADSSVHPVRSRPVRFVNPLQLRIRHPNLCATWPRSSVALSTRKKKRVRGSQPIGHALLLGDSRPPSTPTRKFPFGSHRARSPIV